MAVTLDYVTLDDLEDVMTIPEQAQATDDAYGAGGTISGSPSRNERMVKRFLKRAESTVDSYLTEYDTPIQDPPYMLEYTILLIARYYLDERGDGDVSEASQRSYDQAMDWLKMVKNGEVDLQGVEIDAEDYYGDREGGTFGVAPHNDRSTAFTGEPF